MLKKYYLGGFFWAPIPVKRYQNTSGFAGVHVSFLFPSVHSSSHLYLRGSNLDLLCVRQSDAAPFCKKYAKLHFDAKHSFCRLDPVYGIWLHSYYIVIQPYCQFHFSVNPSLEINGLRMSLYKFLILDIHYLKLNSGGFTTPCLFILNKKYNTVILFG